MIKKTNQTKIQKRTNLLRAFINLLAVVIFFTSIYYLFTKGFLQFLGMAIYSLVLLTPRFIYNKISTQDTYQISESEPPLLNWVEILVTTAIVLNSIGYLWLFDKIFLFFIGYDTFAHFITPILITSALTLILMVYYKVKNIKVNKSKFVLSMAVITVIYTFFWELFEYVIDLLFQVGIYGEKGQPLDTYYDLIADLSSIPIISVLIYKYFDYVNSQITRFKRKVKKI